VRGVSASDAPHDGTNSFANLHTNGDTNQYIFTPVD
jgi:hypothetical protein